MINNDIININKKGEVYDENEIKIRDLKFTEIKDEMYNMTVREDLMIFIESGGDDFLMYMEHEDGTRMTSRSMDRDKWKLEILDCNLIINANKDYIKLSTMTSNKNILFIFICKKLNNIKIMNYTGIKIAMK